MKEEYIVINRKKLEERLKELNSDEDSKSDISEQEVIEDIIVNSTPLNPLLENAFDEGMLIQRTINDEVSIPATRIKNYINNLKIEI